jgi:hypothetical protein
VMGERPLTLTLSPAKAGERGLVRGCRGVAWLLARFLHGL